MQVDIKKKAMCVFKCLLDMLTQVTVLFMLLAKFFFLKKIILCTNFVKRNTGEKTVTVINTFIL